MTFDEITANNEQNIQALEILGGKVSRLIQDLIPTPSVGAANQPQEKVEPRPAAFLPRALEQAQQQAVMIGTIIAGVDMLCDAACSGKAVGGARNGSAP